MLIKECKEFKYDHKLVNIKIIDIDKTVVLGLIQKLDITKDITQIKDYDGNIIDTVRTQYFATISRARLYKKRLASLFHNNHVNSSSQRKPFNIVIEDKVPSETKKRTFLKNCWFAKQIQTVYTTDDLVILEVAKIQAESIENLTPVEEMIKDIIE